ncbi:MAG: hypothetical protein Q7K16_02345 [Candidatus Azambacteria bacterium]|nr:hypothetical protein [Candidatus Azambacteria bacterium]
MTNDPKWSKLELAMVQEFLNKWAKQTTYSAGEFLDMRAELEKFRDLEDPENKFQNLKKFAAKTYDELSKFGRAQLPGLKEADEEHEENRQKRKRAEGIKRILFKKDGSPNLESWGKIEDMMQDHEEGFKQIFGEKLPDLKLKIRIVKALENIERAEKKFKNKLPYVIGVLAFIIFARSNGLTFNGNIDYILAGVLFFMMILKPALVGFGGVFGLAFFVLSGASFDWLIFGFLLGFIITWPRILIPLIEKFGKFLGESSEPSKK